MSPDPTDDDLDEIRSTISINCQYAELLEQLLIDLDICLRQPLMIEVMRYVAREVTDADPGALIDCVGFHALHLRQLINDAERGRPTSR